MKEFDRDGLAAADGKDGRPALVAVDGNVYDVSTSKKWAGGSHMKRHQAGSDLSDDIKAAPHGPELLERFEAVGVLRKPPRDRPSGLKGSIDAWLDRHPFFRRHPHPAIVHIPVGLLTVVPLFEAVALITGSARTEWTALCCFVVGLVSIPAAMATGYFTWWINYDAVHSPVISAKRRLAWIALGTGIAGLLLRFWVVTDPVRIDAAGTILSVVALVTTCGLVGCVGFLGGKLTFPYE